MKRVLASAVAVALASLVGCTQSDSDFSDADYSYQTPLYSMADTTQPPQYAPAPASQYAAAPAPAPEAPPPVSAMPASEAPKASASSLDPILGAADPSAAVDAYAKAVSAGVNKTAAEDAYVRRLVDLGVPELAASQAANLNQSDPNNGTAWAVTSYVSAKKNDTTAAIADIAQAVDKAPKDPFVDRTAGQLVAWYETRADKNALTKETADQIAKVKSTAGMQQSFVEAYDDARNMYAGVGSNPTTQPSGSASAQPPATEPVVVSPESPPTVVAPSEPYYVTPPEYGYGEYSAPVYSPAYGPSYWWCPPYYSSYPYFFSGAIILIPSHHHSDHDHFDHDHFDHNRFVHDHFGHDHHWWDHGVVTIPQRNFSHDHSSRTHGPVILNRPETHFPQSRMIGPMPERERPSVHAPAREPAHHASPVDSGDARSATIRIEPSRVPIRDQGPRPAPSRGADHGDRGAAVHEAPARFAPAPAPAPAAPAREAPAAHSSPAPSHGGRH